MSAPLWFPRNDTERALADALEREDSTAYVRILATAELHLPQVPRPDVVLTEGAEAWTPLTRRAGDQTAVPVFTSVENMGSAVFVARYAVTDYAGLQDHGVRPDWLLAVNPGTPIEAYLPMVTIDDVLRTGPTIDDERSAPAEETTDMADENPDDPWEDLDLDPDLDQILNDPEYLPHPDEYLEALLDATVIVPTSREVDFQGEAVTPEFPWRLASGTDTPTIEVFTSAEVFNAAYPGSPQVRMPFLLLMISWPDGHALSVNPGGPVRMTWPADQMRDLQRRAIGS